MGKLVGPVWQPAQIMDLAASAGFTGIDNLVMATAIAFAECDGYINSYNDNYASDGKTVVSRDVGIWEINIPADDIGTSIEKDLYIPANNAKAAFKLWSERGWEPWASYTSKVVFDDHYLLNGLIGLINYSAGWCKTLQESAPERAAEHSIVTPLISIPQFRTLYPNSSI